MFTAWGLKAVVSGRVQRRCRQPVTPEQGKDFKTWRRSSGAAWPHSTEAAWTPERRGRRQAHRVLVFVCSSPAGLAASPLSSFRCMSDSCSHPISSVCPHCCCGSSSCFFNFDVFSWVNSTSHLTFTSLVMNRALLSDTEWHSLHFESPYFAVCDGMSCFYVNSQGAGFDLCRFGKERGSRSPPALHLRPFTSGPVSDQGRLCSTGRPPRNLGRKSLCSQDHPGHCGGKRTWRVLHPRYSWPCTLPCTFRSRVTVPSPKTKTLMECGAAPI